jgi:hypothetical protein
MIIESTRCGVVGHAKIYICCQCFKDMMCKDGWNVLDQSELTDMNKCFRREDHKNDQPG